MVGQRNSAAEAGAEADAVIGAGNVVVHGFGNGDDFEALLVQANAVAERVIAADGDHVIDAKPFQIFKNFWSDIVFFLGELTLKVFRYVGFAGAPGIGARGMKEGAASAASAIDYVFGEQLEVFGIVVGFVADHFNEPAPTMTKADDLITFAESAESYAANGGIGAGDIAASGEETDDAFYFVYVCHGCALRGDLN